MILSVFSKEKNNKAPLNNSSQDFFNTEMQWLNYIIKERYYEWLSQKTDCNFDIYATLPIATGHSPYEQLIQQHQLDCLDRVILALSFAKEHSFDVFSHLGPYVIETPRHEFPFGGKCTYNINRPFAPTYETAVFLMAGTDPKKVQKYSDAIESLQQAYITAQLVNYDILGVFGRIRYDLDVWHFVSQGKTLPLDYGTSFSAEYKTYNDYSEIFDLDNETLTSTIATLDHYLNPYKQSSKKSRFLGIMYGNYKLHNRCPVECVANTLQLEYYCMTPHYLFELPMPYFELCIKSTFSRLNGRHCILQIEFFHQLMIDDDLIDYDEALAEKQQCFVDYLKAFNGHVFIDTYLPTFHHNRFTKQLDIDVLIPFNDIDLKTRKQNNDTTE